MLLNISVNNAALRAVLVFLAFLLLLSLAFYLHVEEPDLKKSEIIKIMNSGLVIIGIMYSILTYEFTQAKTRNDIRISKCSATYKIMGEWYTSPMIEYVKNCREFENRYEYQLLKDDIVIFTRIVENNINYEFRKSIFCILNYFEVIAVGISEDLMDERFVRKYFSIIFFDFYNTYFPFIEQRRKIKNDHEIWKEFTNLVNKWKN